MSTQETHFRASSPTGSAGASLPVARDTAGFEHLSFQVRRLIPGQSFSAETAANELGIVMLGGVCSVESSAGGWPRIGGRANVFGGVAHTLYLPIQTRFNLIEKRMRVRP